MGDILARAVKEAAIIVAVVVVVAMGVNFTRDEGIPLIAGAEDFTIRTNAEFMVAKDAGTLFENGAAIFVDAREPRLFEAEHIEGAVNVPSAGEDLGEVAYMIPADPVLICYATEAAEREAGVTADRLLEIGFKRVYVLRGGLESWKALGLPTVEGTGP